MSDPQVIDALQVLAKAYLANPHNCFKAEDEGTAPAVLANPQLLERFVAQLDAGLREWMFHSFQNFEDGFTCRACGRFDAHGKEAFVKDREYTWLCRACLPQACKDCTRSSCAGCAFHPVVALCPGDDDETPEPDFPVCKDCGKNRDGEQCNDCHTWVCAGCEHRDPYGRVRCDECHNRWCDLERERQSLEADYNRAMSDTPLAQLLDDNPVED